MDKDKELNYTGERIVHNKMHCDVVNFILHLNRYVFSLKYCVNKNVLDVACGTGYGMSLISNLAKNLEGIDIDGNTIDRAKKKNFFNCPTKFQIKDLEKDKILGNFDSVISFETIEHLSKPEIFLKNIKSALSDCGILVFSVPINEPYNKFHKRNYDWGSIEELIKKYFSSHIEWYSQTVDGIFIGKKKNALAIIGVAYKNLPPFPKRVKKSVDNKIFFLKKKTKELLRLSPKTRW
jgi:SAM-dependent methyltransferase